MDKDELVERELSTLNKIAKDYMHTVEDTLTSIRQEPVTLWLVPKDQYRLLTLKVWEDKYKVTTSFILLNLLPFWESFVQRRSKKMKRAGLNVKVSTLTGKKSEQILQDSIKKLYPNQENITIWMNSQKEYIIQLQLKRMQKQYDDGIRSRSDPSSMRDEDTGRILELTDFSTPKKYINYYRRLIHKEQVTRDAIQSELIKYGFRNNPFRPETL